MNKKNKKSETDTLQTSTNNSRPVDSKDFEIDHTFNEDGQRPVAKSNL